jgi:ring-1,2-phenylacetyl-CoA epoxidase subunit PaaD
VADPEISVLSIVDLGIVREVGWAGEGEQRECVIIITPTYSGCPATHVIAEDVRTALRGRGLENVRIDTRIAPAWTTDWMSETGRRKLRAYGIAPPVGSAAGQAIRPEDIGRAGGGLAVGVNCPNCDSPDVGLISQFSSTPCKALYRCRSCLEPFELFKCH